MGSERYELSWKEFDQCTSQSFKNHFNKEDFSDVTLACDDDRQIKSHKMILSACSPFFQKVLLNNPHQHPLIYLKGVKYDSLKLILRFMYLGETKVSETDLQSFLEAAEELKGKDRRVRQKERGGGWGTHKQQSHCQYMRRPLTDTRRKE